MLVDNVLLIYFDNFFYCSFVYNSNDMMKYFGYCYYKCFCLYMDYYYRERFEL